MSTYRGVQAIRPLQTYLSSLERGIKAPTITKIDEIASFIGVHPLSLLAYAYLPSNPTERNEFWAKVVADLESFEGATDVLITRK